MTNRIAVVTGATGGLGTAMCRALAAQGRKVVGTHLPGEESTAQTKDWQATLSEEGIDAAIYPLDVTDFEGCKRSLPLLNRIWAPSTF